jgi:cytochrome c-type biogenesis protein
MSVGAVALAFVAGVLTSLSPCVLPILPLVLVAAASEREYGPVALAAGLAISFVLVGLFVATIGYSIGLTTELFRQVAAALMVMLGAVLIFPPLQSRLAFASGPIANWTDRHFGSARGSGYARQFWVGVLLGAVWTPLRRSDAWRRFASRCERREGGAGILIQPKPSPIGRSPDHDAQHLGGKKC